MCNYIFNAIRITVIIVFTVLTLFKLHQLGLQFRSDVSDVVLVSSKWHSLVVYSIFSFESFIIGTIPFFLIEMLSSKARNKKKFYKRYAFPVIIWACYCILSTIVVIITIFFKKYILNDFSCAFFGIPPFWHIVLYIILIDFFGYWFHRLEHKLPFLWKFHSTHHSLVDINIFNQYGHWFEGMFRFFIVYLPVLLLIDTPNFSASSIVVVWAVWTLYVHSNTSDLSLPSWARYVFVDNLYHHYHHGYDDKYHDKNFSGLFPIWDIMFGTILMPSNKEFPNTGLKTIPPPSSVLEYITHPFSQSK